MSILRVFLKRTSYTPRDDLVAIGQPGLFNSNLKGISEVHISVVFTWDIPRARKLKRAWEQHYPVVKIGGPAFGLKGDEFVPGKYVRRGVTFTTRGCNRICRFCLVPEKEGKFRELPEIAQGNIVQDNNLLMASNDHFVKVIKMLETQKAIEFKGGLDARLLTEWHVSLLKDLSIKQVFISYDHAAQEFHVRRAVGHLKQAGFKRDKLRCYCLVGFEDDTPEKAEKRLKWIWKMGMIPFAQLYRGPEEKWRSMTEDWHDLVWLWSRPAATKAINR